MTKLDAINEMLTKQGARPISQLDTGGASHAAVAEYILDAVELEFQSRGWHYNTRSNVELAPNGDGHIPVPAGVITIDSDGPDAWRDVAQNGDHLVDLDNNTSEFSVPIKVMYTLRLEFSCIPQPIQKAITAHAAFVMGQRYQSRDRALIFELSRDAQNMLALAKRFDGEFSNVNALNSADARRFRGRPGRGRRNDVMP